MLQPGKINLTFLCSSVLESGVCIDTAISQVLAHVNVGLFWTRTIVTFLTVSPCNAKWVWDPVLPQQFCLR